MKTELDTPSSSSNEDYNAGYREGFEVGKKAKESGERRDPSPKEGRNGQYGLGWISGYTKGYDESDSSNPTTKPEDTLEPNVGKGASR